MKLPAVMMILFVVYWIVRFPSETWAALTFRYCLSSPVDAMVSLVVWGYLLFGIGFASYLLSE
jgi:hypothetical protein